MFQQLSNSLIEEQLRFPLESSPGVGITNVGLLLREVTGDFPSLLCSLCDFLGVTASGIS